MPYKPTYGPLRHSKIDSEVKALLSEIGEAVAATHERVCITKNGREYLVLLTAEDLEGIETTLELLSDPEAQRHIASAEADIAQGDFMDGGGVRALLARQTRQAAE